MGTVTSAFPAMTHDGLRPARGPEILAGGVRFHLAAPRAERVQLCLFERPDGPEVRRVEMNAGGGSWSAEVEGAGAGSLYGFRVHGTFDPLRGLRFNPAKLLLDPAARAVSGTLRFHPALLASRAEDPLAPNRDDSAPWTARSVVVAPPPDPGLRAPRPRIPWSETVIYEAHLRGLTKLHPDVPPELRGTYLGLASQPVLDHLRRLGVTAVELLPLAQFFPERHLLERGAPAYWGYSPAAFLAPHGGYATGDDGRQVDELREMVQRLHRAGLEVIVDVVLNHTMEGGPAGPMVTLRGVDDRGYYRHDPHHPGRYLDFTGCGNTLDASSPLALELAVGALIHWVEAFDVDGFRFDLGPVLGREPVEFHPDAAFFRRLAAEPALEGRKWIAEPWDLGPNGYRIGHFPAGWAEWNDHFRDGIRSFWRGDALRLGDFAQRATGSRDLFDPRLRGATASINLVTCHDGFTLADLVSYEHKHNEDNGENNRDGADHNLSRNWGAEGPTQDRAILDRRRRVARSLLASMALSAGVPMIGHGDERLRTQAGNNNAYCQDGPLTWVDWSPCPAADAMVELVCRVLRARREHPAFDDLDGEPHGVWLHPSGRPMGTDDLHVPAAHALAWHRGDRLLLVNGGEQELDFALTSPALSGPWRRLVDTTTEDGGGPDLAGPVLRLPAGALVYLVRREPGSGDDGGSAGAEPPSGAGC